MADTSPQWLVDDLLRVEELMLERAGGSAHPLVGEAATHLLRAGGKRLRPALVLVASRAGEPGRLATDQAAAALELVHVATLCHDDVIDETDTRRGVPTVHSKWGTEVAVLAGDYLFACGCGLGADAGGEVPGILASAIAAVCEGQISETEALGSPERHVADYTETIRLKTAALFRAAGELGAVTSGAGPEQRAALCDYGENLGTAFQIVDDLLDVVGNPDVTGKIPGTDLAEGVFTLPVLLGAERDPELRALLEGGERGLEALLPPLRASGALEEAHAEARRYGEAAVRALEPLEPSPWKEVLDTVVTGVLAQV